MNLCKEDVEYLDYSKIGIEGCLHLSKAHWPNLQTIHLSQEDIKHLGNNKIGDEGCLHLSKANWPHLQIIYLCKGI